MKRRQRCQRNRAQHPESEVLLQDASNDVARTGPLYLGQILAGQINVAQGAMMACLRPDGTQRARARIEQREVLRRVGKYERTAHGVITERAQCEMKLSIATIREGGQSRGYD